MATASTSARENRENVAVEFAQPEAITEGLVTPVVSGGRRMANSYRLTVRKHTDVAILADPDRTPVATRSPVPAQGSLHKWAADVVRRDLRRGRDLPFTHKSCRNAFAYRNRWSGPA